MEERELLAHTLNAIKKLNIPYFVTGSVASGVWGEPRLTSDIDIVIRLTPTTLASFCAMFPSPEFYVSEMGARSAVERGGQFNIIHPDTGLKVDVIVPGASPFNTSSFIRRKDVNALGIDGCFGSPEDIILSKMMFYKEGQSEKHLRDITGILKLCPDPIDRQYIEKWAADLDLTDIWQAILKKLESCPEH